LRGAFGESLVAMRRAPFVKARQSGRQRPPVAVCAGPNAGASVMPAMFTGSSPTWGRTGVGREDRSRKRFDANSPRRVGPTRAGHLDLRAHVEVTGERNASAPELPRQGPSLAWVAVQVQPHGPPYNGGKPRDEHRPWRFSSSGCASPRASSSAQLPRRHANPRGPEAAPRVELLRLRFAENLPLRAIAASGGQRCSAAAARLRLGPTGVSGRPPGGRDLPSARPRCSRRRRPCGRHFPARFSRKIARKRPRA
jgi:hypothetical protein